LKGVRFKSAQFAGCSDEPPVSRPSQIKSVERDVIDEREFVEANKVTPRLENGACLSRCHIFEFLPEKFPVY
jgi:hypothetical protein